MGKGAGQCQGRPTLSLVALGQEPPPSDAAFARIAATGPGELPALDDFKTLCEYQHASGLRIDITDSMFREGESLMVEGNVIDSAGQSVGEFQQWCWRDGMDKEYLVFKPSTLKVSTPGTGFGLDYFREGMRRYRQAGAHRAEILADDVGSYLWAREGFDFLTFSPYPTPTRQYGYGRTDDEIQERYRADCMLQASSLYQGARVKLAQAGKLKIWQGTEPQFLSRDDHAPLRRAGIRNQPTPPLPPRIETPGQIADLGRDAPWQGAHGTTWLGREILLGSEWRGVHYFDQER